MPHAFALSLADGFSALKTAAENTHNTHSLLKHPWKKLSNIIFYFSLPSENAIHVCNVFWLNPLPLPTKKSPPGPPHSHIIRNVFFLIIFIYLFTYLMWGGAAHTSLWFCGHQRTTTYSCSIMCVLGIELRRVMRLGSKRLYPWSHLLVSLDMVLKKSSTVTGVFSSEEVRAGPMVDQEPVTNTWHVTTLWLVE